LEFDVRGPSKFLNFNTSELSLPRCEGFTICSYYIAPQCSTLDFSFIYLLNWWITYTLLLTCIIPPEDQKKNKSQVVAGQKRKALSDEVSELKVKRKALATDAEALSAAADDF